ncbi:MAG: glycosyltransferase family 4 protein, partial [Acidobacteriaceae bacterium]|nr:glycosyltransferase family 4 protein [Acidobacteriaceae bacterium]
MNANTTRPAFLQVVPWPVHVNGGVNEAVLGVAAELPDAGYYPVIAVVTWAPEPQPSAVRGIEVVNLRVRDPWADTGGLRVFAGFIVTLFQDIRRLTGFLRQRNVQVINYTFPGLNVCVFVLMKSLLLFRGKLFITFQGRDIVDASGTRGLARRLWRYAIRRADAVVACSKALAQQVASFAPDADVKPIHNGVDPTLFHTPDVPRTGLRRVLHIGTFEHKKAHDVLLTAFAELVRSIPDASLVLVGGMGETLESTRALIRELRLDQRVQIHVNVPHEQIPDFMAKADVFVLPSRSEPFGIVLVEAGAAGLPVVASRVGGIPELLEDGQTGLLVPPDDSAALAAAMQRLLTDSVLAQKLASAWHDGVVSSWTWKQACDKYLRLIE